MGATVEQVPWGASMYFGKQEWAFVFRRRDEDSGEDEDEEEVEKRDFAGGTVPESGFIASRIAFDGRPKRPILHCAFIFGDFGDKVVDTPTEHA